MERRATTTHDIFLEGHLTRAALDRAFAAFEARLSADAPAVLVVDALAMTGYDAAARERFVEFASTHRDALAKIVILTERRLWRVVISAMSLASGMPMQVFGSRGEFGRARSEVTGTDG